MEEVFGDALGLFGAEIEEEDGYVHYGGLKLGVVPKVMPTSWEIVELDRLIADEYAYRRARYVREDVSGTKGNVGIRL